MASRCPVFVVLLLAAAVAVNAANSEYTSPMFTHWIAQQGLSKAKTAGGYYEEVQTEKVCLHASSSRNCRPLAVIDGPYGQEPQGIYIETTHSCCGTKPTKGFLGEGEPLNAVCSWRWHFFTWAYGGAATYYGTDLVKMGFFDVTCEMKDDIERCGSPLRYGMNIVGTGDILAYNKVSFVGKESLETPSTANEGTACQPFDIIGRSADRKHRKEAVSTKPASKVASDRPAAGEDAAAKSAPGKGTSYKDAAKTPAKIQYGSEHGSGPMFYTGAGWIFSGTFYTVSAHHAAKASKGLMQTVIPVANRDSYEESDYPPEKAYVADGYQLQLSFTKNGGYEKY